MNSIGFQLRRASQATEPWRAFLKKFLRASPIGLALLIGLCAAGFLVAASFAVMMLPVSRVAWHHGLANEPPGGRALYFLICLMSAWTAGLIMRGLDIWWGRLLGRPEKYAPNLPGERGRAVRTAAKLYDISFWIVAWAAGALTLVGLMHDRSFWQAAKLVVSLIGGHLAAAFAMIGNEVGSPPSILGLPAFLLVISFFFYALSKALREPRR